MSETYSKSEIDSKLALVEERLDHKFDRLLAEVKEGFADIHSSIKLLDKDINWLKWLVGGVLFLLLGIVVSGGLRWMLH